MFIFLYLKSFPNDVFMKKKCLLFRQERHLLAQYALLSWKNEAGQWTKYWHSYCVCRIWTRNREAFLDLCITVFELFSTILIIETNPFTFIFTNPHSTSTIFSLLLSNPCSLILKTAVGQTAGLCRRFST